MPIEPKFDLMYPRPRINSWEGQPITMAHLKLDGHFLCAQKSEMGQVQLLTRQGTDILDKMSWHRLPNILHQRWPNGTCLFGELHVPGKPASKVKTAIKNKSDDLRFSVFHVPSFVKTLPIDAICDFVQSRGLEFVTWYGLVPESEVLHIVDHLMKVHSDDEGFVLKDGPFGTWYKIKHTRTLEAIISGTKCGEGKYFGLIGSLTCSMHNGVVIANVSGMTDDERLDISATPMSKLMGKVIEIKYDRVDSRGKLRHPRFVRFRPDKNKYDCGSAQDPALLSHFLSKGYDA